MKHRYVYYKDRPEWADVKPVPQYESDINIVRIAYSPEFVDSHDYMRAVLLKDERSERALEITATVLQLNPANYTVWEYRRRILITLNSDLEEELKFVGKLLLEHSKNYQLWHHRQWIVTQLADNALRTNPDDEAEVRRKFGSGELSFTESVIEDDSKHYHAWQHRRWAITHFNVPVAGELAYTEQLLKEDVFNNSAWNHRFVTVTKDEGLSPPVLQREVEFVQNQIRLAPTNDSSWNYLYGLLVPPPSVVTSTTSGAPNSAHSDTVLEVVNENAGTRAPGVATERRIVAYPPSNANLRMMRTFAEQLGETNATASTSAARLGFLVEVYTDCIQNRMLIDRGAQRSSADQVPDPCFSGDPSDAPVESLSELVALAQSVCEQLAVEIDRIRATYWRYRSRQIEALASGKVTTSAELDQTPTT